MSDLKTSPILVDIPVSDDFDAVVYPLVESLPDPVRRWLPASEAQ